MEKSHRDSRPSTWRNYSCVFGMWACCSLHGPVCLLLLLLQTHLAIYEIRVGADRPTAGLIYMCMNEFRAIKSLISSLYVPDPQVKVSEKARASEWR